MNALGAAIPNSLIHALGWALVHSLWQGAAIAAAAGIALHLIPSSRARQRCALACASLLAIVVLAAVTGVMSAGRSAAPNDPSLAAPAEKLVPLAAREQAETTPPAWRAALNLQSWLPPVLPWLVAAWVAGVAVAAVRQALAWRYARILVRRDVWPVGESLASVAGAIARHLGVRRAVRVLLSARVAVPAVVGWLRPVVLLPLSAMTGLTGPQLEAIIAHELAHIARNDYLMNLLQTAAETLLFYHPAAWWLSRRIRAEREHCCDDIAAREAGPVPMARALAAVARLALPRQCATAAVAADGGGGFFYRVRRLIAPDVRTSGGTLDLLSLALLAAIVLSGTAVYASYVPLMPRLSDLTDKLKAAIAPPGRPLLPAPPARQVVLPAPAAVAAGAKVLNGAAVPAAAAIPFSVKAGDRFSWHLNDGGVTAPQVNVHVLSTFGNQATLEVSYSQPGGSRNRILTVDQSAIPSVVAHAGEGSLSTAGAGSHTTTPRVHSPVQWNQGPTGWTARDNNTPLTVNPRAAGAPEISIQPGVAHPQGTRWVPSP